MKTIYLKGDIGFEITADKVRSMIDLKSSEKLQVIVNSPGGFVFEAFEIFDLFEQYKGQIEFVLMPLAASAMSYIVMAGKNSKIRAFKNSVWMGHKVQNAVMGDADDFLREAAIMQALENVIIGAYQRKIKIDKPKMIEMLKAEMWVIGWEQLTESGIIDDVIDSVDEIELPEEEKREIEKGLNEAETNSNLLKMRVAKTLTRVKNESEKNKNSYERVAAKLNISNEYTNPYPNEHAARIREPGDFKQDTFRRKNIETGIDIIIGKLKSGGDSMETQAYRFNVKNFTAAEAKKWLKDHDVKYISFEAASGEGDAINPADKLPVENKISTEDNKMKLNELLKANPEAQAEYDLVLKSAKEEGKAELEKAQNALASDRKRIAKILEVASAQLTPETVKAIEDGMQPGDFVLAEVERVKKLGDAAAQNQSVFAAIVSKQTPGDQTQNVQNDDQAKLKAFDEKLNKALPKKEVK